jgi:tape measure domain-containing protein
MDIAELGLVIRSDGVVVAKNRLRDFESQASQTEKRAAAMGAVIGRAFAAIGAALSVRELAAYADQWSDMQSRVGAAIRDMGAAPAMMQRMVDLANASYSPLQQTVEVYSRNVGILRDLGYEAGQAADFTEALNHALVITATRGERAQSVQDALSKAMATGRLQADGLETVLANGGRVAEALADQLDTTVSGLRAMASEGKITGDVIARSLTGSLEELRTEAAEMPATIGDAFVRLNNNVTAMIGTFDKANGISATVAATIMTVADNLDILIPIAGGLVTVLTVSMIPAIWAGVTAFTTLTAVMITNPFVLLGAAVGVLAGHFIHLSQQQALAEATARTHIAALINNANAIEVAKTSSQGFRDQLRANIQTQLQAAEAAYAEAAAQKAAAAARTQQAANTGNSLRDFIRQGMGYEPIGAQDAFNGMFDDNQKAFWEAFDRSASDAQIHIDKLKGQLGDLGNVEANYKPVVHTLDSVTTALGGAGGAAAAANDNMKSLASDGLQSIQDKAFDVADGLKSAFQGVGSEIWNAMKKGESVLDIVLKRLDQFAGAWIDNIINNGINSLIGSIGGMGMGSGLSGMSSIDPYPNMGTGYFPAFANGTNSAPGGMAWVGERGRELVKLPKGSQVFTSEQSRQIAANQNQPAPEFNFYNAPPVERQEEGQSSTGGRRFDIHFDEQVGATLSKRGPAQKAAMGMGRRPRR